MSEDQKAKLKREISKRWYEMAEDFDVGLHPPATFAQLEYILQEAGLLARPRRRRARIENLEAAISA